jgi:aminoglycoside phosphotransferase (APT) family kinase protein
MAIVQSKWRGILKLTKGNEDTMHQTSDSRCRVHGDFRPDNLLFNLSDANQPIVVVDWLMVGVGCDASDIDYSTGTALHPDMRRTEENGLNSHYQTSLIRCGVPEADTVDLWQT